MVKTTRFSIAKNIHFEDAEKVREGYLNLTLFYFLASMFQQIYQSCIQVSLYIQSLVMNSLLCFLIFSLHINLFWYYFDHKFLIDVVRKICDSVRGVNRVCQDITSKPPGTAEWELRKIGCWVARNELVRHCYL